MTHAGCSLKLCIVTKNSDDISYSMFGLVPFAQTYSGTFQIIHVRAHTYFTSQSNIA